MAEMLKAVVFSDLHLNYSRGLDYKIDLPAGTDVVIIAGDITDPVAGSMKWLHENVASLGVDVIFVAGNHEHYGHVYSKSMAGGRAVQDQYPHVHWLENQEVIIKGVRFLGATMWTDFELFEDAKAAMKVARLQMNDYNYINVIDEAGRYARWTPEMTLDIHKKSRNWLRQALATPHNGPTVVVTHHCPHIMSVHPKYAGDALNCSFTSDLESEIVEFQPDFWFHGHTHSSFNYTVPGTKTQVICNPRGYVRTHKNGETIVENAEFEPSMMVEIPVGQPKSEYEV